jgi:hypothetical protein
VDALARRDGEFGMIAIVGCGALGSRIALELRGQELLLWDDDRVEEQNVGTSAYSLQHARRFKTVVLSELCARRGIRAEYVTDTLDQGNTERLSAVALVVDCLDNAPSRALLTGLSVRTLHVGVSEAGSGSCLWDHEGYKLPDDGYPRGHNPVCTHQLNAQLLRMTATVAVGVVEDWLSSGVTRSALVTARQAI